MIDLLFGTLLVLGQVAKPDQPPQPVSLPIQQAEAKPNPNVLGTLPAVSPAIGVNPGASNIGIQADSKVPTPVDSTNQSGQSTSTPDASVNEEKKTENEPKKKKKEPLEDLSKHCFFYRLAKAYSDEFHKKDDDEEPEPEKPRRALPSPWDSPPFPVSEYQGYPLIGVPPSDTVYPFMKAVYGANTPFTDCIKDSRIKFDAWITTSGNYSTAKTLNTPDSYWIQANRFNLEQQVFRLERQPDTVQTDHMDYGFRFISLYGMDYRYTTAGGWGSDQLLKHNKLYGWDPVEEYINVYIPGFLGGTDIRVGRWIACPDIETQYAPDNYMASHSLLFTFDTYTQTGVMLTQKINNNWTVQGVIHSGTDMAPWYKGSLLTGAFGVRWVAEDNNNAVYAWANALNSAQFRHFEQYGQPLGHDNFNYIVATWEHRFCREVHTKTEAYYMWQYNAELGGTPSAGPLESWGGGGGDGTLLPGLSRAYGVLNYTAFQLSKQDYVTVRNEWYRDERGMRTGFEGTYTTHAIGLSHNFNALFQVRPEIGYYDNWTNKAFDNGNRHGVWIYGFDCTMHF